MIVTCPSCGTYNVITDQPGIVQEHNCTSCKRHLSLNTSSDPPNTTGITQRFINWWEKGLIKGRLSAKAESAVANQADGLVPAEQIWGFVRQQTKRAASEGWNIFASIEVRCPSCDATYRLTSFGGSRPDVEASKTGHCYALDSIDMKQCEQCESNTLRLTNSKRTFESWLRELCGALEASKDDPGRGFDDIEQGGCVVDHPLRYASDFDSLWGGIRKAVDIAGDVNAKAKFDIIFSRSAQRWRKIRLTKSIVHANYSKQGTGTTITTIIKGSDNRFWYSIERTG